MKKNEKIPGQFVSQVTCSEILISTGIQLVHWAHDIAFTDAAFGESWAVEAANRMASLSELLNVLYKRLPRSVKEMAIDLPPGMIGQVSINPAYDPDAEKPEPDGAGDSDKESRGASSIDELPF